MSYVISLIIAGLGTGALVAIIAASFALILRVTGIFHFAHGAVIVCGALLFLLLSNNGTSGDGVAFLAALASASTLGGLSYAIVYRRLEIRQAHLMPMFVSSLGILVVIENVLAWLLGTTPRTFTVRGIWASSLSIGSVTIQSYTLLYIGVALLVFAALSAYWYRTRTGRYLRAIEQNRQLCRALGVPYVRYAVALFLLASALGTAAAILLAVSATPYTPFTGTDLMLTAFVAIFVGGRSSMIGSFVGGEILGLISTVPLKWVSPSWIPAVEFLALIAVLVWKPEGIAAVQLRRRASNRGARASASWAD